MMHMREVDYVRRGSDQLRFARAYQRTSSEYVRRRRAWYTRRRRVIAGSVLGIAVCAYVAFETQRVGLTGIAVGFAAGIVGIALYVRQFLMPWTYDEAFEHLNKAEPNSPTPDAPEKIRIDGSGVTVTTQDYELRYNWRVVDRVVLTDDGVMVTIANGAAMYVPLDAFASQDDARAFVDESGRLRAVAGPGLRERVREILRQNGLKCERCRYSLKGSDGSVCPECGTPIDHSRLSALPGGDELKSWIYQQ